MQVAIVKYNAGNIYSVVNALRRLGVEPLVTDDKEQLLGADRVVFPGQGEASGCMKYLREHKLDSLIKDLRQPVLGICVGQQLLCRHSEEGDTDCIGIFDADVKRFQPQRHEDKVPCMGWNSLHQMRSELFSGLAEAGTHLTPHPSPLHPTCTSYTASTCPCATTPQPRQTTYCPILRPCTRTISMPASSIPRRADQWASAYYATS